MQTEDDERVEASDTDERPKVLVMAKVHRLLMMEGVLWLILLWVIKMQQKMTKTARCDKRDVAFIM
jgi:hypothetical protein